MFSIARSVLCPLLDSPVALQKVKYNYDESLESADEPESEDDDDFKADDSD